jgi:hypothetical protein
MTIRSRKNRRRPSPVWAQLPKPRAIADACGRAVRRSLPGIAATAVVMALGTSAWLGYRFITTSDRFAITEIVVRGNEQLTEQAVLAAMPLKVGDNIFAGDLHAAVRALRQAPWIAAVDAHRELPDRVVVELREHVGAALVELGGLYLVDHLGRPFKRARLELGEAAGFPVITGIGRAAYERDPDATSTLITRALEALEIWREDPSRPEIGEIHVDPHHAVTLRTHERAIAIRLGHLGPNLSARVRTFDAAWGELSDVERQRAHAVHVAASASGSRFDQVTVAFAPTTVPAGPPVGP